MPDYDSGVKRYIVGVCQVQVFFPVNWKDQEDVRCEMCRYYSRQGHSCRLNGEIVEYPEKFVGSQCPLEFQLTSDTEEKV